MTKNKQTQMTLQNNRLALLFVAHDGGVMLGAVRDLKRGKERLSYLAPLFSLKAVRISDGSELTVDSASGWSDISLVRGAEGGDIMLSDSSVLSRVSVTIKVLVDGDRFVFETYLSNANGEYALLECDYAALTVDLTDSLDFFSPYGPGEVHPAKKDGGWSLTRSYPSYGASMQYLALFDRDDRFGIYYGLHDPAPAAKKLCCNTTGEGKTFTIKAFMPLADIKSGTNGQKLCGRLVWQAFDGDWYDAAMLYRDFIENEAEYAPDYDENGRKGIPDWARNVCQWFNTRVTEDKPFADEVIARAKDIGVTTAVHLYYWHQIPFDNDYPHYFPMKSCVVDELKKFHDAGIKVMPYINGRLWDTRDKEDRDFEFTSVAKPWCTKMYDGKPFVETYSSKEKDGSPVELAVMCPSATLWQDKVCEIVTKLFDVGFDAVYIDQIAAAEAKPCTDPHHEHSAGGGEWWCHAYNTLLERISRTMPDDRMLTTECSADPYMKHLGGYLSWLWVKNNQVPAFPAIFSDKVISFGTDFRALGKFGYNGYGLEGDLDEGGCRIFAAQSFLFGQQMGWMLPNVYDIMPYHDYYKTLVRERETLLDFFNAGRLLRPPVVSDDAPKTVCNYCREAYNHYVEENAVTSEIWRRNSDGAKVLLAVNSSLEEAHAKFSETGIPDGIYNGVTVRNGAFELTMQPLSMFRIDF